ncbi:glycosyltransferase [Geobacter sp. SVR]|uniref:glycosyltransferase n=1 Tax=Geobacter sp. SVR TaxID=2495594 RepID=UPI00143EF5A0|nr:glycosyltransferase [Geobacter sp. SVR]BCS55514.1 glycosyl transferase [Geobacter sp. SVR]GCF83517.1 glycosyl transferase [Geobacter sp. SVR]
MPAPPLVSILMPVRNEARYLQAALSSLFRQTLPQWELIAIDDGSTDATPEILAEAASADPRVRVLRLPGNGLVTALNAGLEVCRATLVARMDGDDICHPQRLARQIAFLDAHPDVGLVACGFRHFPRSTLKQGMIGYETWQNGLADHDLIMRDRFVESPFVHPSVMIRRSLLVQAGGYRASGWAEDYDLWLRLAEMGTRFARLHLPLFFWRDHPERATRTLDDYSVSAFRSCKAHYLLRSYLSGSDSVIIAGAGLEGRAWQRLLEMHGVRTSCWLDVDPRKVGRTLHGAPVVSPHDMPRTNGLRMIVAIGVRGAREQFRALGATLGLREGLDFVCVA